VSDRGPRPLLLLIVLLISNSPLLFSGFFSIPGMPYFNHEKLDVYQKAIQFVSWTHRLPSECDSRVSANEQLHRASRSIPVNIAEGNSKRSSKARGYSFDVSYGSSLECAACLDVLVAWKALSNESTIEGKGLLSEIVSMLLGLRRKDLTPAEMVQEDPAVYGSALFDHESLPVYRAAIRSIEWAEGTDCSGAKADTRNALDKSLTSIALNIAEGNGRFSTADRGRYLDQAHASALRCAATLDVAVANGEFKEEEAQGGKMMLSDIVSQLIGWGDYLRAGKKKG